MAGRKPPGAFDEHAHAQAEALRAGNILDPLFAGENGFVAITIDSDVGVSHTQFFCA